jgi:hypothetical protein
MESNWSGQLLARWKLSKPDVEPRLAKETSTRISLAGSMFLDASKNKFDAHSEAFETMEALRALDARKAR